MNLRALRGPISVALTATACAGPPAPAGADAPRAAEQSTGVGQAPAVAIQRALPSGAILRLRPTRITVAGAPFDRGFVDALLREALRLSPKFDVAADLEDCDSAFVLEPTLDANAGQLAVSLRDRDGAPIPLIAVPIAPDSIPAAIDRVAWTVRIALGEAVPAPPPRVADIYTASVECARATERAFAQEARGTEAPVPDYVTRARQADPGCALAWNAMATWQLSSGRADEAVRTANEALQLLGNRLSATTSHRLARVLLLARARVGDPREARIADEQLHALGDALLQERPHDPHGRYSRALAASFLGRFADATSDLTLLRSRWPHVPWVEYHLAFARLGAGDPIGALEVIDAAARRLPPATTLLPRALALYGAGEHGELDDLLERGTRSDPEGSPLRHELLRMQAAHAILTERREAAVRALLEDLEWLRERPTVLSDRAVEVAEAGEVLVRLGALDALAVRLEALRAIPTLGSTVRLALAYVQGISAATAGDLAAASLAVSTLERAQSDAWATRLRAAVARARGDLASETRELATAVRLDDDPMVRAAFARALREIGRHAEAQALLDETRERMSTLRLRAPLAHPLLSPGRALAFLATEPARSR